MNDIYSFEADIKYIKDNRNQDQWNKAYRFFFPEISHMEEIPGDDERQKVGVDWIIYMKDGTQYNIDEKLDKKGYPRFPIEILHRQANNHTIPGWALKEGQQTHYIAYLVEPKQDHYLIPYQKLRSIYLRNEQEWVRFAKERYNGFVYGITQAPQNLVPHGKLTMCVCLFIF